MMAAADRRHPHYMCNRYLYLFRVVPYLNLGLGTYCGLPPVGWVHILVLFLMVFIPVSTQATSDVGTK